MRILPHKFSVTDNRDADTWATGFVVSGETTDAPANDTTPYQTEIDGTFTGDLSIVGDRDWVRLDIDPTETVAIEMTGTTLADPYLRLYDAGGTLVAENNDFSGLDAQLTYTTDYDGGTYYIEAGENGDDATGSYSLNVTEGTPGTGPYDPLDALDPGVTSSVSGTTSSGGTIDVYFAPAGETYDGVTSEGFNAYEIQQFQLAFDHIEEFTNLTFNITTNVAEAEFQLVLDTDESLPYLGAFYLPGGSGPQTGLFNGVGFGWDRTAGGGLEQGGYGYITIVHELGHGLALGHPHDTSSSSIVLPGVSDIFNDTGNHELNQGINTMMTYVDGFRAGPVGTSAWAMNAVDYGYQGTMMGLDIAALQDRYSANMTHATGNDSYSLPTVNTVGSFYQAIWDAGGDDTIVNPGSASSVIDLRPATLHGDFNGGGFVSGVDAIAGGFTIANGVEIENAFGGSGADQLIGSADDNRLLGNDGMDTLLGLNGDDTLDGGDGNDDLQGGRGDDLLQDGSGGDGIDTISAGAGDDVVSVRLFDPAEIFSGGSGFDILDVGADNRSTVSVDLSTGVLSLSPGGSGAAISGFEAVYTGSGDNTVIGDDHDNLIQSFGGSDTVMGGGGRDTIDGGLGGDSLDGGKGSDDLIGGLGADTIIGGGGNDTVTAGDEADFVQTGTGSDVINAQGGNDTINGGPNGDLIFSGLGDDSVSGGGGQDTIWGNFGNDTLRGANGTDTIYGEDGNDLILGEARNDYLDGGIGNDTLRGGDAGDTLVGGAGDDDLRGENNADLFVFEDGFGSDRIRDFDAGNNNEDIDLSGVTAITDYADLLANHMTQSGSNVIIEDGSGDRIRIDNVLLADMNNADFIF